MSASSGVRHGEHRFGAVVTVLAVWLVASLHFIAWADSHGLITDPNFSPYQLPGYVGLVALVAVVASRVLGGLGRRRGIGLRDWRSAVPPGYGIVVVGTLVLVAFVVLNQVWIAVFGIQFGIEASITPTRLLLVIGLVLVSIGPLLAIRSGGPAGAVATVSLVALVAALNFGLLSVHPLLQPWAARPDVATLRADSEIWTMLPDGGRQTRLLPSRDNDVSMPAWSADASRIVYVMWTITNGGSEAADLWTMAADGSDRRQVTDDPAWDWIPAWSPDGSWIAFSSQGAEAVPSGGSGLPQAGRAPDTAGATGAASWDTYLVRPDGSDRHVLVSGPGSELSPAWSPDGSRIAVHAERDGNSEIIILNADGSGEQRIASDPADDWSAAWSPDGTRLAFTSARGGSEDIWVTEIDGTGLLRLTDDPAADQVPAWSPDGSQIAFVSNRTGDAEVWTMAADGSDQRNISSSPGTNDGQWSVTWSPDGKTLAYAKSALPPLLTEPIVREDLGLVSLLLFAVVLAAIAVVAASVAGLPIGSLTIAVGVGSVLLAVVGDEWRFVPGSILAGVLADVVLARARSRSRRRMLAAIILPTGFVALYMLTLAVGGDLGWSTALAVGSVVAAALVGWGLASLADAATPEPPHQTGASG